MNRQGKIELVRKANPFLGERIVSFVFLLLFLLLTLSGCEKCAPPKKAVEEAKPVAVKPEEKKPEEINLKETRLATVPDDYEKVRSVSFSADGRRVAYAAWKGGKQFVVVNDTPGKPYDAVWTDTIALSRDGQRIAYSGKRQDKWYFVLDGKEWGRSYENTGSIIFSPDGRLLSCEAMDKGKWFIVVYDGEKEVYRSQAYRDSFRRPVFSPDGRLLVYELGERGKKRLLFFLDVSDRKLIKKRMYDEPGIAGKFSYSSDFSRIAYEAAKERRFLIVLQDLVLEEKRTVDLPDIMRGTHVLSPDGKKIAYLAAKDGKQFIVMSTWESPAQGKERGHYDAVSPPAFSPDSTKVAYYAIKDGKWRSVVGEKEGASYDVIGNTTVDNKPVFSPDGLKIAYPAMKNGKWFMVVSPAGNPSKVVEGPSYDMVVTPVFSPDGKYIAYRARAGTMEKAERFLVIADAKTGKAIKNGPVCDEVWPPVWSADGKAAAYGARIGRELWWKVERVP